MKIKLALLDSDQNYLNRIVTAFNIKYADKLEIYSFTKLESAMAALEPSRIDVLVASDTFVVESSVNFSFILPLSLRKTAAGKDRRQRGKTVYSVRSAASTTWPMSTRQKSSVRR